MIVGDSDVMTEPPTMPPMSTDKKPHVKNTPKIWRSRPDRDGFLQRYCEQHTALTGSFKLPHHFPIT